MRRARLLDAGWWGYLLCAGLYVVSGLRAGDWMALAGSLCFLAATACFLVAHYRGGVE